MPERPPESARRLQLGCDQAAAALVELGRTTSPTLWTGPAASSYAFVVESRTRQVRAALDQTRAAAAAIVAAAAASAPPAGGG